LNKSDAILLLSDGKSFSGTSFGVEGLTVGEVVFNTSMTGYQEIITDPSYDSQIITFTNPHIGNTGINNEDIESDKIYAAGLIIRDQTISSNNWRSKDTLQNFLIEKKIVGISNIDTRELTKVLRSTGSQNGCIMTGKNINMDVAKKSLDNFTGLLGKDLAKKVSTKQCYQWKEGVIDIDIRSKTVKSKKIFNVVAYDFGIKHNIMRILHDFGCKLTIVPADYSGQKVIASKPDGIFLSNGPGDPDACDYAINNIKLFLEKKIPIFGICLGFQLLALASGGTTTKMKFGHHGANHPVMELDTKKVFITSQNHGFMVDENTLPDNIIPTHKSLFDNSLQGFMRKDAPAFGFQGHPEASPGPQDINKIFLQFISMMKKRSNA